MEDDAWPRPSLFWADLEELDDLILLARIALIEFRLGSPLWFLLFSPLLLSPLSCFVECSREETRLRSPSSDASEVTLSVLGLEQPVNALLFLSIFLLGYFDERLAPVESGGEEATWARGLTIGEEARSTSWGEVEDDSEDSEHFCKERDRKLWKIKNKCAQTQIHTHARTENTHAQIIKGTHVNIDNH